MSKEDKIRSYITAISEAWLSNEILAQCFSILKKKAKEEIRKRPQEKQLINEALDRLLSSYYILYGITPKEDEK